MQMTSQLLNNHKCWRDRVHFEYKANIAVDGSLNGIAGHYAGSATVQLDLAQERHSEVCRGTRPIPFDEQKTIKRAEMRAIYMGLMSHGRAYCDSDGFSRSGATLQDVVR